jgi:hypothetical protein
MKKILFALLTALLLGAGFSAKAGMLADLSVISRSTGRALPVYSHHGRYYVAGTPGEKYAVAVRNKTGQRVMTVVSVDGVNVVSGETAVSDQTGYVLWSSMRYEINGWRKSTDEVAAFVFTALPDSYAARTDRPGNVGVIGVAVFREYEPPRPVVAPPVLPVQRPFDESSSNAVRKSAEASADANGMSAQSEAESLGATGRSNASGDLRDAAPSTLSSPSAAMRLREEKRTDKLGTGHGEREASQVSYTDFRRASDRPAEVISIYYDSYNNLLARGIIPRSSRVIPNPFPGSGSFVPDPRG